MNHTLVVGAGPAGLATSQQLKRRGIQHHVLEKGGTVAHTWKKLYDSLTLHTGKHLSSLPGMPFPASTPLFPSRNQFLEYLNSYAVKFQLPIETACEVTSVEHRDDLWIIRARGEEILARNLVIATGILSNPNVPDIPGSGRFQGGMMHSVEYLRPDPFVGKRVLVVGAGNSAGEISSELAKAGALVTVSVRSGNQVLPRDLFGIPIQYYGYIISKFPQILQRSIVGGFANFMELLRGPPVIPRPLTSECPDVPLIGFQMIDAIKDGLIISKPSVAQFTEIGATFTDGTEEKYDQVILATGFNSEIGILSKLIRVDDCGFAARKRRVLSQDQPNLYFVGHNYDATGGLNNIARDARIVSKFIALQS